MKVGHVGAQKRRRGADSESADMPGISVEVNVGGQRLIVNNGRLDETEDERHILSQLGKQWS